MDFVFLSTQGWDEMDGAGRPTHYLARELLQRGHRVLFVELVPSRARSYAPNLTLLDFNGSGWNERALRRAWFGLDPEVNFSERFARALDEFQSPGSERVVVYGDPFVPFVALWSCFRERGFKIVYDALDAFDAFPEIGLYFANPDAERFLVAQSDLVVAVSTTVQARLNAWGPRAPVQLLRQGFDSQTFRAARFPPPHSAPSQGSGLRIGFWGHVNAFNLDTGLIRHAAQAHPEWTFQLIGPVDQDPALPAVEPELRSLPNVQLVGRVAHHALPTYLSEFDVAIVPFPDMAFNRGRDPLKVLEYLSGYKPVIAAHTPQLAGMPYVWVASTPDEFIGAIERACTVQVERAVVDAYLEEATWPRRLDQLLDWLAGLPAAPGGPAPDVAAWYGSANLAPNWGAYIAQTEQLLDERTAYARALEAEAQNKQAHIEKLEATHPFWQLRRRFRRE
jgi:glycosyltransferase involved in cell wall biosynthesis